jgi:replication factor A1
VSVLDSPQGSGSDSGGAAASDETADGQGLSAFGNSSETDASTGGSSDSAASSGDGQAEAAGEGEEREFTGTVVQAGNPVVLDNGSETQSVETNVDVRLGEEITVRGRVRDGRIHAEEVF